MLVIQDCGASAFGIVTLVTFLSGDSLGSTGAVQLQQSGAAIYVADLVGIAMSRDMGAMMTAIIMAGRTGAAFAAQLGSMKVTQEIDALTTMGISPLEFLVLPRVLAVPHDPAADAFTPTALALPAEPSSARPCCTSRSAPTSRKPSPQ